ncbi:MAG: TetR/AcrR family transcriptional regulator [Bacteroidaceae bacterium]|nr:TetR/AcrR family transcriptional regulator [Bacteroidaceae bacterium]
MGNELIKNRQATEQNLLNAVHVLVEEVGFEGLGINAIAAKAGVSKMLIYRYFNSLDGLISAYIAQYDFWINAKLEVPEKEHLGDFIKTIFANQIKTMRENYTLRRLYRWELAANNSFVTELRHRRETKGMELVACVSKVSGRPTSEVAFMATLVTSSISYLVLLEENCPIYNGINIQQDEGWIQMGNGINRLIDSWLLKQK